MKKTKKELKRFLVAGFGAVGTDLISYYLLLNTLNHNFAKTISFLLGTVVAFSINKYWTFEKKERNFNEVWKFGVLYMFTLSANVLVNKVVLDFTATLFLAFLIATGVSTVLNFLGQKFWVFR